jgi:hypothetical protein
MSTQLDGVVLEGKPEELLSDYATQVISWLKAFTIMTGLVSINVYDILIGGMIIALMFGEPITIGTTSISNWLIGFVISTMLAFIQIVLWDSVLRRDRPISWSTLPAILLGLAVAVADTNIDVAPIFLWLGKSNVKEILAATDFTMFGWSLSLYDVMVTSLGTSVYIATGFSELFTSLYIVMNKRSRGGSYSSVRVNKKRAGHGYKNNPSLGSIFDK